MPRMPVWVAKALKEGWARTFNQFLKLQYAPGRTRFQIEPVLQKAFWLVYGWNYGQMLDPDGVQHYSSDFRFLWIQGGIKKFEDYMEPSMMDYTYPVFLIVTKDDPVITVAINDTGEIQTVDFTAFIIWFGSEDNFNKWSEWFNKRYGISPWKLWRQETGPEELKARVIGE